MKKGKFLTLDDLYNFYSSTSKRSRHFNSKDEESNIVVQVPGSIIFESDDNHTEGLTPVRLQACHTDENLNKSNINKEVMEKALPSFSNRPILGYIHSVNGEDQFYDHRMHMEDDDLVYDEYPVGIIKESCNAHLEEDTEKGHTYVVVDGYLFDEYSSASEILEREQTCKVSVELSIRELSFDAKSKIMNIEDFYFSGVTILGYDPDGNEIREGMEGSNIKLADFQHTSKFAQSDVMSILQEMNDKIDALGNLDINNSRKEDTEVEFEENVEVTENEEITPEESTEEVTVTEEETDDVTPSEEEEQNEEESVDEEKFVKTFELSHDDIRCGLYALLAPYEESDNEWYAIMQVYDDHFIYGSWFNDSIIYDQKYVIDGDNISFEGERVHMNAMYLNDSEKALIDTMRSNYEEISEKLAKYEAEPEKIELLNSDRYSLIKENDDFKKLSQRETYFDLSVEDIKSQADNMLLEYAAKAETFSAQPQSTKVTAIPAPVQTAKVSGRYGGIFSKTN